MMSLALSYVALVARDVDAACRFLGESLGLARTEASVNGHRLPFFRAGASAVGVFELDDPYLDQPVFPGVHHIALTASAPRSHAERAEFTITSEGIGPNGARYVTLDPASTCGIRTRFIESVSVGASAPGIVDEAISNGAILKIDHLGIASDDIAACLSVFVDRLGCELESTETDIEIRNVTESFVSDKYGAVYHARSPEILGGLHGIFVNVGDCELEIMMDYDPNLTPLQDLGRHEGNTKGDQSAIANFVARRGPGLAHVAFATKDIDAVMAQLENDGWQVIDRVGRPGGRGSRIAFVHPANFGGGLLMHLVEPRRASA